MPKTLFIDNTDITRDKKFTFLTEDIVSGGSSFRVQSVVGFNSIGTSSGQIVQIGETGSERSEQLRTSNSASPSQTYKEVTLRDTLNFDHPQDTKVYIIDWNRADVQWSQTITGTKSTLTAYPNYLTPDQTETIFIDTVKTSGYYFIRFNETVVNTSSDWSDAIPFGGFDDNTVFAIKQRALDEMGETIDGKLITNEYLNQSLWEARRDYHSSPGKRPFRRNFNKVVGTALTGSFRIELPTDVEAPFTAENIYGVRIGTNANMSYYDKKAWDIDWSGKARSYLVLPYVKGVSTSLWLNNGGDFKDSGSIMVEGTNVGVTRVSGSNSSFTITYHGNWSASSGSDAYQNTGTGLPYRFTAFADPGGSAYIYFNCPIDTVYVNNNIYIDYYRTLLGYDSNADILDEPNYDMFVSYLKYKIAARKARGNINLRDNPHFQEWQLAKAGSLQTEYLSTDIHIVPNIDHLQIPN